MGVGSFNKKQERKVTKMEASDQKEDKRPILFTHMSPDQDSGFSVCWWRHYKDPNIRVMFVPADWDGQAMSLPMKIRGKLEIIQIPAFREGIDVALDIDLGGKGIKGSKMGDTDLCCFATLVYSGPHEDAEALKSLVTFVNEQDTNGSAFQQLLKRVLKHVREPEEDFWKVIRELEVLGASFGGEKIRRAIFNKIADIVAKLFKSTGVEKVLADTSVGSVFRALQSALGGSYGDDQEVLIAMQPIFDGFLKKGHSAMKATTEADQAEIFEGRVALVENGRHTQTTRILLGDRGYDAVVYVDGCNIGVVSRDPELYRMDAPKLRAFVKQNEDPEILSEWFSPEKGYMYARGTRKARKGTVSRVNPQKFVQVILEVLKDADAAREAAEK